MPLFKRTVVTMILLVPALLGCRPRPAPSAPSSPTTKPNQEVAMPQPDERPGANSVARRAAVLALVSYRS
ncbi:MAG: hypothetical protein FD180_2216 [Planctomycetota bacterium]|nr:MAG: hypothetical protein FD180_2216 [Planctomycetota bacterium]